MVREVLRVPHRGVQVLGGRVAGLPDSRRPARCARRGVATRACRSSAAPCPPPSAGSGCPRAGMWRRSAPRRPDPGRPGPGRLPRTRESADYDSVAADKSDSNGLCHAVCATPTCADTTSATRSRRRATAGTPASARAHAADGRRASRSTGRGRRPPAVTAVRRR